MIPSNPNLCYKGSCLQRGGEAYRAEENIHRPFTWHKIDFQILRGTRINNTLTRTTEPNNRHFSKNKSAPWEKFKLHQSSEKSK